MRCNKEKELDLYVSRCFHFQKQQQRQRRQQRQQQQRQQQQHRQQRKVLNACLQGFPRQCSRPVGTFEWIEKGQKMNIHNSKQQHQQQQHQQQQKQKQKQKHIRIICQSLFILILIVIG